MVVIAEGPAETTGRDKVVEKELVVGPGRGCEGGPVKGIAVILLRSQGSDSTIGS